MTLTVWKSLVERSFVDKLASPFAEGTLARPFNNIANSAVANAFGSSSYGDIVRIVGNGGIDGDITTESDNFSYQIGTAENGGAALTGWTFNERSKRCDHD